MGRAKRGITSEARLDIHGFKVFVNTSASLYGRNIGLKIIILIGSYVAPWFICWTLDCGVVWNCTVRDTCMMLSQPVLILKSLTRMEKFYTNTVFINTTSLFHGNHYWIQEEGVGAGICGGNWGSFLLAIKRRNGGWRKER